MDAQLSFRTLVLGLLVFGQTTLAFAAGEDREVPKALVPVLNAAERAMKQGDVKTALKILNEYSAEDDALHALMKGHAYQELKDNQKAEIAYRRALKLDTSLKPAKLGLAQILVDQSKWSSASQMLGQIVNVDTGSASELGLYARVAYELKDLRLASLLVERAILRFPSDLSFRRLDISLLMERGETKKAYEAARALLARAPNDPRTWKQLAAITQDDLQPHVHLAALEAALLANDNDLRLQRRYAMAQYQAGHFDEALATVSSLIKKQAHDLSLIQLGVRIAEENDRDVLAQEWLTRVPQNKRTKTLTLLEARLAIKSGHRKKARSALDRLIRAGEATPNVLLWAGQLAEQTGADAKAEALYQQASNVSGSAGRLAVLHLARLFHRMNQLKRASQLLSTYLTKHPEDEPARELLAVISQRGQDLAQN
jgi:predicted Zn-dependent protease